MGDISVTSNLRDVRCKYCNDFMYQISYNMISHEQECKSCKDTIRKLIINFNNPSNEQSPIMGRGYCPSCLNKKSNCKCS